MFGWVCANSVAVCAFLFVSNYLYINVVDIVFDLFCCFVALDLLCCVGFGLVLYSELVTFSDLGLIASGVVLLKFLCFGVLCLFVLTLLFASYLCGVFYVS